jgi:two-component system, NtrC family, response regulator HydG
VNGDRVSKLSILVIDDDPRVGRSLERALQHHQVDLATSFAAAQALVRHHDFDVVLCDLRLGNDDGREVCASLMSFDPLLHGRCILMSGEDRDTAESMAGPAELPILEKPFSRATLHAAIETRVTLVGARRLRSSRC